MHVKSIEKIITMLFLVSSIIFTVNSKAADETSIDAQIEHIKNADPKKRRELMNKFKEQLATMNRKERMDALSKLLGKMQVENGKKVMDQLVHMPSRGAGSAINRQTGGTNSVHHMSGQPSGGKNMQFGHQHR